MDKTTIVLDGLPVVLDLDAAKIVSKMRDELSEVKAASEKMVVDHAAAVSAIKAERDAIEAERDAAKEATEKSKLTQDQLDKKVAERLTLVESARRIVSDYDATGNTDDEVRKDILGLKKIDVVDRTPEYIRARFDVMVEDAEAAHVGDALGAKGVGAPKKRDTWQDKRAKRIHPKEG